MTMTKEAWVELGKLQQLLQQAHKQAERANALGADMSGIDMDALDKMEERACIAYATWEPDGAES